MDKLTSVQTLRLTGVPVASLCQSMHSFHHPNAVHSDTITMALQACGSWCGSCWHMKCHSAYCCSLPPRASHSLPMHLHLLPHHCLATLPSYYTYLLSVPLTFTLSNHSHCSQFLSEQLHITQPNTRVLVITGPLASLCQRSQSH